MPHSVLKKRKADEISLPQEKKKVRKQRHYSSPSESEEDGGDFPTINLAESDEDEPTIQTEAARDKSNAFNGFHDDEKVAHSSVESSEDEFSDSSSANSDSVVPSNTASNTSRQKSKRNDPEAFAASVSAILSSKLTSQKRPDPVLARSSSAQQAASSLKNEKLEAKAKRKLKEDKKKLKDKGRIRNVLLGTADDEGLELEEGKGESGMTVAEIKEQEKMLKKTAQRGVIKLFNAVRAAQVKAEQARAQGGTRARVEERVDEMSKKGFLEMVAAGGKKGEGREGAKKMSGEGIEEA